MTRFRATLAYDGTAYAGYQVQPDQPTVQGQLENALARILKTPTTVYAAGRTDTGVHATGQVIAFDAEWKHGDATLLKAVNSQLPDDIALQDITQQADFHPRFDALSRTYRYTVAVIDVRQPLLAKRAWQMQQPLDINLLQRAAMMLVGEHDFATFGQPPQGNNTVRHVFHSVWQQHSGADASLPYTNYVYEVRATAFLYHMVRRMVGMQIAVGSGRITLDAFEQIFHNCDLSKAKWFAPPHGLSLTHVAYPPAGISRREYYQTKRQVTDGASSPSEVR
ncbi:MAG: tRNA pseudouridine(38-40) synthase TruA [Chloroflexota bacterium]